MSRYIFLLSILCTSLLATLPVAGQGEYRVGLIGFYNFENLFDTLDTPDVRDSEFTPTGSKHYDSRIYQEKLTNLSKVVSEMGTDLSPDGAAILGVCEIENASVLEDFVQQPSIRARNYQIVHYDSPDERGIDVGLLYNPKYFTPDYSTNLPVLLYRDSDSTRDFTRDVLYVTGDFDGDRLHIFVNHWPSRSGGEAASQPKRNAAAMVVKQYVDSLYQHDPESKIIIMGDLNDDPISPSVASVIGAEGKLKKVREGGFFNPMYAFFRKGLGTLAYRDSWNLFDQILISEPLIDKQNTGYRFYKTAIHNPRYMYQQDGRYKGYPFRTFAGDSYLGGYSDHFPVYLALVKPVGR